MESEPEKLCGHLQVVVGALMGNLGSHCLRIDWSQHNFYGEILDSHVLFWSRNNRKSS